MFDEIAQIVFKLYQLCDNVRRNKNDAKQLTTRCQSLAETVKANPNKRAPAEIDKILKEFYKFLVGVEGEIAKWAGYNVILSLLAQQKISKAIVQYHVEIDWFCDRYMITTQREIVAWQMKSDDQADEDHQALLEFMKDSANANLLEAQCRTTEIKMLKEDISRLIDQVQEMLLNTREISEQHAIEQNFSAILRGTKLMPTRLEITKGLISIPDFPIAGGRNSSYDIYRGLYLETTPCAVKVLRRVEIGERTRIRFNREHTNWKSVYEKDQGKHILPLIGIIFHDGPDPFICMISIWMEKGNALQHVQQNKGIDRQRLIRGIAEGLRVLHTHNPSLAHGNVRASNVLINDFGDPLLADFGLTRVIEDVTIISDTSLNGLHGCRWMPPEMLYGETSRLSAKSDIFMFGMTVLELMTNEQPYAHIHRDPEVIVFKSSDKRGRPLRPGMESGAVKRGLDDVMWALLEHCWAEDEADRPDIHEVLDTLPH